MIQVNITLLLSILSILAILASGILFIYRVAQKYDKSIGEISTNTTRSIDKLSADTTLALSSLASAVKQLTDEVVEIKAYKRSIDDNTKRINENDKRISLVEQRCALRLKGEQND